MWYAILASHASGSAERRAAERPRHLEYLQRLRDQGRLMVAGPHPSIDCEDPGPAGVTGSLIIAEFESAEAARSWADADPYATAGIITQVDVKPFTPVMP